MASNRVNYNDTLPAAPTGRVNIAWQADATVDPANVSANVSIGSEPVNAQTGTSYTFLASDLTKLVTHSNGSAIADTLPVATGDFGAGWWVDVRNLGAGTVTITPTTSTINGASTLVLTTNQSARIISDGSNYQITNLVRANSGTVTSVALTVPSWLSVAGSPITASGTLAVTATTGETANEVLATPDGTTGAVSLRALLAADIPALAESKITDLVSDLALKAPLASPTFTGTPAGPTPLTADNSTTLATTAYVKAQGFGTSSLAKYTTSWSAQTSVTVTHGLSTTAVIVQVFDSGGVLVIPESVTVTSSSVVTLTFGAAFTGSVVVIG